MAILARDDATRWGVDDSADAGVAERPDRVAPASPPAKAGAVNKNPMPAPAPSQSSPGMEPTPSSMSSPGSNTMDPV